MIFNAYAQQTESVLGLTLVSCGHIFASPGREINRPHGRKDWLLFYIAAESETFFFPKTETGQAGSFVVFAPGEPQCHRYTGDKTAEFYYVHFRTEALPVPLATSHLYHTTYSRAVCDLFESILDETQQKRPHYETLCLLRLSEIFTLLQREADSKEPAKRRIDRIARAVMHMNRADAQLLSLADYARLCGMSKYHFLKVFEQSTGQTPLAYRNRIRLERAAALLREESFSVSEISEMLGFSSPAYFSSAFKKQYGVSPGAYRTGET